MSTDNWTVCPQCKKKAEKYFKKERALQAEKALDISEYLRSGWICPICKMVNSPNSSVCACRPLPKFEPKE